MSVIRGEPQRTFLFCIDSYVKSVPTGRIYSAAYPEGKEFRCLMEMLDAVETALNSTNYPQSFTEMRRFITKSPPSSEDGSKRDTKIGELATFTVKILFRQNTSWQGSVAWLEGQKEEAFRSALELIFLMNSVLEEDENEKDAV